MYAVDGRDRVVSLDVPQCSVGAPLPVVVASEDDLFIAYLAENPDPDWDGSEVRSVDPESLEPVVVVSFRQPYAHMFGPPNDEAIAGHPLASRGVAPYAAFRVEESSWIRTLEKMNRVHEWHRPAEFSADKKHFIFSFHDTTFECVAASFNTEVSPGSLRETTSELGRRLR